MLKLTSKTRTFDVEINGEVVQYPINTSVSNALRCIESARKAQSQVTKLQAKAANFDAASDIDDLMGIIGDLYGIFEPMIDAMLGMGATDDVCQRLGLSHVDAIEQVMDLWQAVAEEAKDIAGEDRQAKAAHYLDAK